MCVGRSVYIPPFVCPLRMHVSSCVCFQCVCRSIYRSYFVYVALCVCPLMCMSSMSMLLLLFVPLVSMSLPCVSLFQTRIPSFVCSFRAHVSSVCMSFLVLFPPCVCPSVVCPSVYVSLRVCVFPCVCLFVYTPSVLILHLYVSSVCSPSVCFFLYVCPFHVYP